MASEGKVRLENLVKIGQLKLEPGSQSEIDGLISSARPRLKDSANKLLSLESRFDLSYNAAHALSLAALRWHGYRSENRFTVFQCLQDTLLIEQARWRILDDAHRKRNNAEYSGIIDIDEATITAVIEIADEILKKLLKLKKLKG